MRILRLDDDIHAPAYCTLKRGKLIFYSLNELLTELAKPHKEEYEIKKYHIFDSEEIEEHEAFDIANNIKFFRLRIEVNEEDIFNTLWEKATSLEWW